MIPSGKKIYLCRPNLTPITVLNGVKTDSVNYDEHVKDFSTLSFEVDEYIVIDGKQVKSNGYDLLDVYLNLYLEDIGYFQMQYPNVNNDGVKETKSITAYSIDKEFEDKDWVGLKINTGETDSLEQLAENNVDELGFAKEFVKFYNPERKDLSLINLVLERIPGWTVLDEDIDPLLWDVKLSFSEDNINLYALLTSTIAPKAECIFLFDILHKRIKAVSKHSLDYETNIFIGFRNLANSVDISVDEDTIYTRFNCEGADGLNVRNWNYNDSRIIDLSYFMHEPYMSTELISKVQAWLDWRKNNRETFANLSKDRANKEEKISELQYRVPNDGDDWQQWDAMTEELLYENLAYYNALLTGLQISVDTDPQYDSDGNYIPWKTEDITVDHDKYLTLLYELANGYGGYYTYWEVLNYIIPNIEIAISNLGVSSDNKKDFVKDYETNWELYGIEELTAKKKDYEEQLEALKGFETAWELMTDEEKASYSGGEDEYNILGRSKYIEISGYLGTASTEGTLLYQLKKLNDELTVIESELDAIDNERLSMIEQSDMSYEAWGFNDDDILTIHILLHDTDYQNTNILSTSVDTTVTVIDREKELYDDSVSKLSEVSQPQMKFTANMDNLLNLDAFQCWHNDFKLLRYIRLGIRDDYSVKLRLVGRSWNPCEVSPDLTVEFSNMITSRSGRSDLTDILNGESNRGSKNSISIGTGNSDSDKEYMTNFLQMMIKNRLFKNTVENIASNTSGDIDAEQVNRLIANYAKFQTIDVNKITGDEASFEKLFSTYIDVDFLAANTGNFDDLFANITFTDKLNALSTTTAKAVIDAAYIADIVAKNITVADLKTGDITISDQMRIMSENGNMLADGNTLQFLNPDGEVGIQIGYADNEYPSIIVKDENGATIMTSQGITENAVSDGLIKNNMVSDGTLGKEKLNFPIVETDENGKVSISEILDENGDSLGERYTEFKTETNIAINELKNLEIGGTNLVRNTRDMNGWLYHPTVTFSEDSDGLTVATFSDAETVDWRTVQSRPNFPYSKIRNKTVTLSFYARADANTTGTSAAYNSLLANLCIATSETSSRIRYRGEWARNSDGSYDLPTDWRRYTIQYDVTDDLFQSGSEEMTEDGTYYVIVQFQRYNLSGCQIKGVKLEVGNKATDWSPAPEDMDLDIANAQSTADEAWSTANQNAEDMANIVTTFNNDIANLQTQIDGSITTWFYEVEPTETNEPAVNWTTVELKNIHLGDLYYDTITGYCYRWQVLNNVYSWQRITDTDVTKALADAQTAQDTADQKRRVFYTTPSPPYDKGDLWVQGDDGDILRCSTAKVAEQSYATSDWVAASKYTDDTVANEAKDAATTAQNAADNAQADINNLEIGGRNLIIRSQSKLDAHYNIDGNLATGSVFGSAAMTSYISIKPNTQYTFSRSAGGGDYFRFNWYDTDKNYISRKVIAEIGANLAGTYTWTSPENAYYLLVSYPWDEASEAKLERGNRATDWTPAPEDIQSQIEETAENIASVQTTVESVIDKESLTIKDSVWESTYLYYPVKDENGNYVYDEDGNIVKEQDAYNIIDRIAEQIISLDGITTTVGTTDSEGLRKQITTALQTANQFYWLVKDGSNESSLTLTDSALSALTGQFVVKSPDGKSIIMQNGMISTDIIKSTYYEENTDTTSPYSIDGTYLNLENGNIYSPNFAIDNENRKAYIKGEINALSGKIGGCKIEDGTLKVGSANITNINADAITTGTLLSKDDEGNVVFSLDMDSKSVSVSGEINALSGEIGGWDINEGYLSKDVTVDGTDYRVYLQPPGQDNPGETWILSCQTKSSTDTGYKGNFILYGNGSARFGNTYIDGVSGSAYFGNTYIDGTSGYARFGSSSNVGDMAIKIDPKTGYLIAEERLSESGYGKYISLDPSVLAFGYGGNSSNFIQAPTSPTDTLHVIVGGKDVGLGDTGWHYIVGEKMASENLVYHNNGSTVQPVQYRRHNGVVYVRGCFGVTNKVAGESMILFTLPSTYRSSTSLTYCVTNSGAGNVMARYAVNPSTGSVALQWVRNLSDGSEVTGDIGWLSIDFSFPI
ncbi:MAG: hypothetical protein E7269_05020 [Lachnospiraceae bacterium]|nr:hypothetical protein [Lachnospiraceae bacterium]